MLRDGTIFDESGEQAKFDEYIQDVTQSTLSIIVRLISPMADLSLGMQYRLLGVIYLVLQMHSTRYVQTLSC